MKTVISASRRTDLIAHYPDRLAAGLEEIGPGNIHTLVLWTKNPLPALDMSPLRTILESLDSIVLHLTVTGLGGTVLEPEVPPWRSVLSSARKLMEVPGLRSEGVFLRYDPLAEVIDGGGRSLSNVERTLFTEVATEAREIGIGAVRTSVMTVYGKVTRRLEERGFRVSPGSEEKSLHFMETTMLPVCSQLGLSFQTCVNPDRGDTGCIDGAVLTRLHPKGEKCSIAKDRSQRQGCHCTKSLDMGKYYSCAHGCLYCYGNPVQKNP